jgi:CO/xanthine dehydrogenase Mo-binding subunit
MQLLQAALAREDLFAMRSKNVGVGLALATDCATPGSSAFNPGEGLKIRVEKGNVILGLGYGPEGQGNEHTAVFLTAKLLGIPVGRVSYEILDTTSSIASFGPGGSRMGVYVAGAVTGAVDALKSVLKEKATRLLGTSSMDYRDGSVWGGGKKVSLLDLEGGADYVYSLHGRSTFTTYPFCCNISVVKLSETGRIIPLKQVVYIDPGTPLDEDLVKEQLQGGTATGIALALYEQSAYDETGNLVSATLGDYGMPTAADLPDIEVHILPTPSPSTPMGAKGIGEIPVGVAAAAITSAVEDVLKRRITKIPIEV